MDVLSEVLKSVTLRGALFYNAEFSAPWAFRSPPSRELAPYLSAGGAHVIIFHLVTEGRGTARLDGGEAVQLDAGDVVVFPHGDPHAIRNGAARGDRVDPQAVQRILARGLAADRQGGGGAVTRFICGFMACDPSLSRLVLAGLPPMFKVGMRRDSAGQWLERAVRLFVDQAEGAGAGMAAVLGKLADLLFVDTLRRHVESWPEGRRGWLAAARDPEVGRALALMHAEPARPWTLGELAREAGLSRSALAERFRALLGAPPMAYLAGWRLQVGARLLTATSRSVGQVAAEVGYESETAFNRAFKRAFGEPPARFRSRSRQGGRLPAAARARRTGRS